LGQPLSLEHLVSNGKLAIHMDWGHRYDIDARHAHEEDDTKWNSHHAAMQNANALLDIRFGHRYNRKKATHSPQLFNKALVSAAAEIWKDALAETSSHTFRSAKDIHPGFLFAHYMLENRSIPTKIEDSKEVMLVLPKAKSVARLCKMLMGSHSELPQFFSLNNHMSDEEQMQRADWIGASLHHFFPNPSQYEDLNRQRAWSEAVALPTNMCKPAYRK